MSWGWNKFILLLLSILIQQKKQTAVRLAEIKAATYYVEGIKYLRLAILGCVGLSICLLLMMSGFIVLHLGLLLYLPWPLQDRAILMVALGGVYLVVSVIILMVVMSQRTWMRCTKANEVVRKALR